MVKKDQAGLERIPLNSLKKHEIFPYEIRIWGDSTEVVAQWKAVRLYQTLSIDQNPVNPSLTINHSVRLARGGQPDAMLGGEIVLG